MKDDVRALIHETRLRATFKQQVASIECDIIAWQTNVLKKMYYELNESVRLEALSACETEEEMQEAMRKIVTPPSLPVEQIPIVEAIPLFGLSLLLAASKAE